MPGFDFTVAPFGLVSRIDTLPNGMGGFAFQTELTRTVYGFGTPEVMDPFVHLGLSLVATVRGIRRTAQHTVGYDVKGPDGLVETLVQAKPSDWPAWTIEGSPAKTAELAIAAERDANVETPLLPTTERFSAREDWLGLRPLALYFRLPGLHVFRLVVDTRVAAEFDLNLVYERRAEVEAPV
jgi:hypothetical protein